MELWIVTLGLKYYVNDTDSVSQRAAPPLSVYNQRYHTDTA